MAWRPFVARAAARASRWTAEALYPSWQRLLGYVRAHLHRRPVAVDPRLVVPCRQLFRRGGSSSGTAASARACPRRPRPCSPPTARCPKGRCARSPRCTSRIPQRPVAGLLRRSGLDELHAAGHQQPMSQPRLAMGEELPPACCWNGSRARTYPPRTVLMPAELIESRLGPAPGARSRGLTARARASGGAADPAVPVHLLHIR
jgi:LacI family transcriptional regulator